MKQTIEAMKQTRIFEGQSNIFIEQMRFTQILAMATAILALGVVFQSFNLTITLPNVWTAGLTIFGAVLMVLLIVVLIVRLIR